MLAANGTELTMKVSTATLFPQGTVFLGLKKPITLTVPANALVDVGGTAAGKVAGRIGAVTGRTAIVLTQAAKTTIETQTAEAGAFSVARIVLQSSPAGASAAEAGQRPLKSGSRFSANARMPSTWSSVAKSAAKRIAS